MQALPPGQVAEDLAKVMAMGLPLEGVTEPDLETQSRYYLAFRSLAETLDRNPSALLRGKDYGETDQ